MKELTNNELIIHTMANWRTTSVFTSTILVLGRRLFSSSVGDKIAISATPRGIMKTVLRNKEIFKISKNGHAIELVSPEKLEQYVAECKLEEDVEATVKQYVTELGEPLAYAFADLEIAKERENYLLAVPIHIEWLLKMAREHIGFNSFDYHMSQTADDLENFTLMPDFYRVVSKYCEANLIPCSTQANESYVVSWGEPEDLEYVELHKIVENDISYIRAIKRKKADHAVYYGNIAFGVQDESFEIKQNEIKEFKKVILNAKVHGIPYKTLKAMIDDLYDVYPDLHED